MKLTGKRKEQTMSLRQYMQGYPEGIGIQDAVAMLLPAALQLRDMHNNGTAHLQVSPDSVFVGADGARLRDATAAETDRYISGYASPEIYRGISGGNLSDIYSFCAVLSFAASGKHPANALARADSEQAEEAACPDPAFLQIIQKGMAPDGAERFASMQELILKLSAYHVRPFVNQPAEKEILERKPLTLPAVKLPKIKLPKIKLPQVKLPQVKLPKLRIPKPDIAPKKLALIAAALLLVLTASYMGCYSGAKRSAEAGDYIKAEKQLWLPAVTKLHDAQLLSYLDALELLDGGSYEAANAAFEFLSGYLDADTLAQEADFRLVQACAQENDFEKAFAVMEQLQRDGYEGADEKTDDLRYAFALWCAQQKDFENALQVMTQLQESGYAGADYKICEFHYSRGMYLLDEMTDYEAAYEAFSTAAELNYAGAEQMKQETVYREACALIGEKEYVKAYRKLGEISGYRDVDSSVKSLEENMYRLAQKHYRSREFDLAEQYFKALLYYEDSLSYRQLISARNATNNVFAYSSFMIEKTVEDLVDMFYFEDTATVLLSKEIVAKEFLRGTWKGDGYYFTMDDDYRMTYNLPVTSSGDTYMIYDGMVELYEKNNREDAVPAFYMKATSPDCISVLCFRNYGNYTLYRQ